MKEHAPLYTRTLFLSSLLLALAIPAVAARPSFGAETDKETTEETAAQSAAVGKNDPGNGLPEELKEFGLGESPALLEQLRARWLESRIKAFTSGIAAKSEIAPTARPQNKDDDVLVSKPTPPEIDGHYAVSMGTVIPALLLGGVNSDLPGYVLGQVSEHVYDTGTGRRLLIPQGSRLFGEYDSTVIFGQKRPMIRWQRLVFPDGSTVDLSGMAGVDKAGYSGFKAEVNNHYLPLFTTAVMLSVFSAASEIADDEKDGLNITLSQPTITLSDAVPVGMVMLRMGNAAPDGWKALDGSKIAPGEVSEEFLGLIGGAKNYPKLSAPDGMVFCVKVKSVKPTLLGSLAASGFSSTNARIRDESGRYFGAEFAEALAAMAEKFFDKQLERAPTLVVKQGYRFNVLVNKTIYLPEWRKE